jgi:hypothetical protein
MAKQIINAGARSNDGTGDSLRDGARKINENFSEIYSLLGDGETLSVVSRISVGQGLAVSNPTGAVLITGRIASSNDLGMIKVGANLTVAPDGTLNAVQTEYQLPTASNTVLGGVKVGTGLSINQGVLSANNPTPYSLPIASNSTLGGIKIGSGLTVAPDGTVSGTASYSLPTATDTVLGGIKIGAGLSISQGVVSVTNTTNSSDRLVNGSQELILDGDGILTFPGGSTFGDNILTGSVGSDLAIVTDDGEISNQWTFRQTGPLVAPGGAIISSETQTIINPFITYNLSSPSRVNKIYWKSDGGQPALRSLYLGVATDTADPLFVVAMELRNEIQAFGMINGRIIRFTTSSGTTHSITIPQYSNISAQLSITELGGEPGIFWLIQEGIWDSNGAPTEDTVIDIVSLSYSALDTTYRDFAIELPSPNGEDEYRWEFANNGNLQLPVGGDIVDSTGNSVLGSGSIAVGNGQGPSVQNVTEILINGTITEIEPGLVGISVSSGTTSDQNIWIQTFESDTPLIDRPGSANSVEYDSDGNIIALFVHYYLESGNNYTSLAKFTSTGTKLWQVRYAGIGAVDGWGVAVDSQNGFIYVSARLTDPTGYDKTTMTQFSLSTGTINWSKIYDFGYASTSGVIDAYDGNAVFVGYANTATDNQVTVVKISGVDGSVIWAKGLDGQGTDEAYGMAIGPSGEVVVIGYMSQLGESGDTEDHMLVAKYSSSGTLTWQKAVLFDTGYSCQGADADIDSLGNIYVVGQYQQDDGLGGYDTAMNLVKFNSSGVAQWSRRVVGDCQTFATSVVVGPDDYLYLSGIAGTIATSDFTCVVAKYEQNGQVAWQRLIDNVTTWSFGGAFFTNTGSGSNIAVKNGYVAIGGGYGDPGTGPYAMISQFDTAGTMFAVDNWDYKQAVFSGFLSSDASDITVNDALKTDGDLSGDITVSTFSPDVDTTNFLVSTIYRIGDESSGDITFSGVEIRGATTNNPLGSISLVPNPALMVNGQYLEIYPTTANDAPHIHLAAGTGPTGTPGDLILGNDNYHVDVNHSGKVRIRTFDSDTSTTYNWQFDNDGTTTFPGAIVKSTIDKTGINIGVGTATGLVDSTWPDPIVDGNYGPFTLGVVTFTVVVTSGVAAYTVVSTTGTSSVGQIIGNLNVSDLGGTPGNSSPIIVTSVNQAFTALDLTKSVNKLTNGQFTLANGVEGQIMYLVPQSGITPNSVDVTVANYRIDGTTGTNGILFPFRIFNGANASYFDSGAFCTLIFTDGAWQQSGGSWD